MVKDAIKSVEKQAQSLIWGELFNHTIILNKKENTKFLDFLIV